MTPPYQPIVIPGGNACRIPNSVGQLRLAADPDYIGLGIPHTLDEVKTSQAPWTQREANPKAIAANGKGALSWSWGAESKLDAEEEALFDCDRVAEADAFLDAAHQHACALVDVNGKPLVK